MSHLISLQLHSTSYKTFILLLIIPYEAMLPFLIYLSIVALLSIVSLSFLAKDILKLHLPPHQRTYFKSKNPSIATLSRHSRHLINLNYTLSAFIDKSFLRLYQRFPIEEIIVYPLKSCGGVSVTTWKIDEFGLESDRMYMLGKYDSLKNSYQSVTQREAPKLALVELRLGSSPERGIDSVFEVWFQDVFYFSLPRHMTKDYLIPKVTSIESKKDVELWGVGFHTYILEDVIPESFYNALGLSGKGVELLYSSTGKQVITNSPNLQKEKDYKNESQFRITKFQEYFPLLLMGREDINDVNRRLADERSTVRVNSTNFRPNIVVKGLRKPYDIDDWYRFDIETPGISSKNKIERKWIVTSKCPRCSIPNVDPITGEPDPRSEVSKLLSKYRRCDVGNPNFSFLGIHAVQLNTGYDIFVGDEVVLHERRLNEYKPLK